MIASLVAMTVLNVLASVSEAIVNTENESLLPLTFSSGEYADSLDTSKSIPELNAPYFQIKVNASFPF